jgi:hypothetical protein
MEKPDKDRCCLCGKPVEIGAAVARIEIGVRKGGKLGFKSTKLWGDSHEECLNRALPTTRSALSELSRLAKTAVKKASATEPASKNGKVAKKGRRKYASATV